MRIVAGADDSGATFDGVIEYLRSTDHELSVLPTESWPEVALKVGESVAAGRADMGLLMCWTGTGTAMMANKVRGVRAALCWEPWVAAGARKWNDANVLVMSLKRTASEQAVEILDAWLKETTPDPQEAANIQRLNDYETGGTASASRTNSSPRNAR